MMKVIHPFSNPLFFIFYLEISIIKTILKKLINFKIEEKKKYEHSKGNQIPIKNKKYNFRNSSNIFLILIILVNIIILLQSCFINSRISQELSTVYIKIKKLILYSSMELI